MHAIIRTCIIKIQIKCACNLRDGEQKEKDINTHSLARMTETVNGFSDDPGSKGQVERGISRQVPCLGLVATQIEFNGIFVNFFGDSLTYLLLAYFYLQFFVYLVSVFCFYLFCDRRENIVGWVGKCGGSGRNWGKEITWSKHMA